MRDADIRAVLSAKLRTWHPESDALVVDELDLLGQVRVDVAVVDKALRGYEIKSARDTLRRLPLQARIYSQVLDFRGARGRRASTVAACALIPSWWEVLIVGGDPAEPFVDRLRPAAPNPKVDAAALVQLLWRDEAISELARRGLDRGVRSKPRQCAWDRLVEHVEVGDLKAVVRQRLKTRRGWRGSSQPG